jgi:predicted phage gp36 major capsid-like protein
MADTIKNEFEKMMAKIEKMQCELAKVEMKKIRHNEVCLNYYNRNKDIIAERRKTKYSENAEKIREERRKQYAQKKEKEGVTVRPHTKK